MPHKYWSYEDEKAAKSARTYRELCAVAFRVLDRVPAPVCFVCGPITTGGAGSVKKNIAILNRHIARLQKTGKNVFNQMMFEKSLWRIEKLMGKAEDGLLDGFYLPLFGSGKIKTFYFVPGWKTSYGAKWEHAQAKRLGIRIRYLKRSPATADGKE